MDAYITGLDQSLMRTPASLANSRRFYQDALCREYLRKFHPAVLARFRQAAVRRFPRKNEGFGVQTSQKHLQSAKFRRRQREVTRILAEF
jgi:hypothetical protein